MLMIPALGAGVVAFVLARAIQSEERLARQQLSCACHKRPRYWIDDQGNVTEFLAMSGSDDPDEKRRREPCPICKRGAF